ncbi:MAG: hypothetical protein OXI79_08950 [Gammaproteobacteria bacterium]|nr:hypothetical protein [Gammaproteobacteria bacterium]
MRTWTNILPLAALAVLFTLPLAGCTEDSPAASMAEAEPETFDAATVYEIVPVGGGPSHPGELGYELGVLLQFDSEKAKRAFAEGLAEDAVFQLVALSAQRTAQIWDDKRPVHVVGNAPGRGWKPIHSYNYDPVAVQRALYGPKNRQPAEKRVPR